MLEKPPQGKRWVKRVKSKPSDIEDSGWVLEDAPPGWTGPDFVDLTLGFTEQEIIEGKHYKAIFKV